ncbi:DJ-1/PfpI family protein [Pseudomonas sp. ABC1]|uniref:DJ-1/PfpI family protein n=1 Tax=Pseudomonas sp. ABC1 TaxID=2748080 RepID=UPI0015C30E6E|nr:DJ-1/PfpI family protein [Pseudomonas sp. ABC1]QLF94695.1 DJ-1/PfpI family protein [Pseudomonas sp. ABC1]
MSQPTLHIGLLLFPGLTQLDLTGPAEVFARLPGTCLHLIWKTLDPVASDRGLSILPDTTFQDCPRLDVICIPGGPGQIDLMDDATTLDFIRRISADCRLVTSVCTGSLVLGAAGLLDGYRATCHWSSLDQLALLGALPVEQRVVRDRNRISGAGVTSGIDFALSVVAELAGEDSAQAIQLQMEYDPQPPFTAGSPRSAPPALLERVRVQSASFIERRRQATLRAAQRLSLASDLTS